MAAAAPVWPRSCGLSSSESKGGSSRPHWGASPRTGLSLNSLGEFSGAQGGTPWGPARLSGWPWVLLCPYSLSLDHLNCLVLKTVNLQGPLKKWHLDLKVPHKWLHFSAAVQTFEVLCEKLCEKHQRCSSPVMSRPQVTWRGQSPPRGTR